MRSELDVKMSCIKFMLFISNFMFVLYVLVFINVASLKKEPKLLPTPKGMVGFLLIAIGATVNSVYYDFESFMEAHHFKPAELLIAIGIIIFLVSLFGCVGAIKESTALINIYAVFLMIIFVLEVSAAIAAYVMRSDIYENIEENMNLTLQEYNTYPDSKEVWDFTQERVLCCGIKSAADWEKIEVVNGTYVETNVGYVKVPQSCIYEDVEGTQNVWPRGCLTKLSDIAKSSALMLGMGCTCIAFVQLIGVLFALALAKTVRRIKTAEEVRRTENRLRIYEELQLSRTSDEKVTPVLYNPTGYNA